MAGKSDIVRGALEALTDAYKRTFSPETYYHGTLSPDLKEFKETDEFLHFGSSKAAQERLEDVRFMQDQGRTTDPVGGIIPVKLQAKNSLKLEEIPGGGFYKFAPWDAENIWKRITMQTDISTAADNLSFLKSDSPKQWISDFLNSKGFDSIEYINKNEDPGSVSKIVFDPSQVRSVHAKFDPKKSKSGNILASVPAGALATGALSEIVDE